VFRLQHALIAVSSGTKMPNNSFKADASGAA
jgi:hypothetical protein